MTIEVVVSKPFEEKKRKEKFLFICISTDTCNSIPHTAGFLATSQIYNVNILLKFNHLSGLASSDIFISGFMNVNYLISIILVAILKLGN